MTENEISKIFGDGIDFGEPVVKNGIRRMVNGL
jgi:hypothetical protein